MAAFFLHIEANWTLGRGMERSPPAAVQGQYDDGNHHKNTKSDSHIKPYRTKDQSIR